jgi:peroxiredoxin
MPRLGKLASIFTIALLASLPAAAQGKPTKPKTIYRDANGNLISNNEFVDLRIANPREKKDPATKSILDDGTIEFRLDPVPQEGTLAPIFDAATIDGKPLKAADLRGKVLVLNLWFIGCPVCLSQIPKLNKLAANYKNDPDVVFIAVAPDSPEKLKGFLTHVRFDYEMVGNGQPVINLFSFAGFPKNIVIGRDGKITYWRSLVFAWDKFESVINAELAKNNIGE